MSAGLVDVEGVLGGLKDFQRRTVEYVFKRLYRDSGPTKRFLVADEVGLGKTLVARGIIAKTVRHLQQQGENRIDILYICSNATIAQQNLNRLNVTEKETASFATRLTLLPLQLQSLKANGINFISFTPGTTFDLRSRGGKVEERALIYRMLRNHFDIRSTPLLNLLQGKVARERWLHCAKHDELDYDETLAEAFRKRIQSDRQFLGKLLHVCHDFKRVKRVRGELVQRRYEMIGELRRRLADVCIEALEPDLVILDEFQRFKDLLNGEDEAAELAQQLFTHREVRVLLLSATPYRMLSLNHEQEDDHYTDFLDTLRFLFDGNDGKINEIKDEFRRFRQALYGLDAQSASQAQQSRDKLETRLRSVIARTERIDMTRSSNAMLLEAAETASLRPDDLRAARFVDRIAQSLDAGNTVEYWKSSPYLINFMGGYELKKRLLEHLHEPDEKLLEVFQGADAELLRNGTIQRYRTVDPANARLRELMGKTVHAGQWQLLWLPPSLPYFEPGGAFAQDIPATKSLIFSSWQVVPDAIAAIGSYECERLMLGEQEGLPRYHELHKKRRQLLQFRMDPEENRPAGMPALALMYPCVTLAKLGDPLAMAVASESKVPPSVADLKAQVRASISKRLASLKSSDSADERVPDQRWYWASLALLDAPHAKGLLPWIRDQENGWLSVQATDESGAAGGFHRHVEHFADAIEGRLKLGRMPDDLADVLTDIALASPAICALRALRRIAAAMPEMEPSMLSAAGRIGEGLRSLFNQPEVTALLRADDDRLPYWRRVLNYAIDGNLQAVLDEYAHILKEITGLASRPAPEVVNGVCDAMVEALSLHTSSLRVDDLKATPQGHIRLKEFSIRCHFAVRFGDVRDDDGKTLVRSGNVRQAFNSPFRPFVLASTSVGQEGLDFHPYCHVVYHWNLPSNPVDMEQREGRVHRYKGHAVRRNLAKAYGLPGLSGSDWTDPWEKLFRRAAGDRPQGVNDLVPYWLFETEGGWSVERRVPLLPLSREVPQLSRLKEMLAIYRLAFGQPRQEDLLSYLNHHGTGTASENPSSSYRISLAPRDDVKARKEAQ
jgi:Helicase conserved C-terminal domain